jgi:thymidylate kinase
MPAPHTFSVALVGPDGVGKTTIARALEAHGELRIKYLYMGDNPLASNVTLPTMRWWKMRQRRQRAAGGNGATAKRRGGLRRTLVRPVRKSLGLAHRVAEEAYRQIVAASLARRGFIILYDRHFLLDYWHTDVDPTAPRRSLQRRAHGLLLRWVLRQPDLVICLDAPGDVVWQRKGELTPEVLERRRMQYRELAGRVRHFTVIDAARPLDEVLVDVRDHIERFRADPRRAAL